jgi:hypothetical protein
MSNPNPRLTKRIDILPQSLEALADLPDIRPLLDLIDARRAQLNSFAPFDGMEQAALDQYDKEWLARYTYNSNAIEGSTLTLQDTELVLSGEFVPEDSPAVTSSQPKASPTACNTSGNTRKNTDISTPSWSDACTKSPRWICNLPHVGNFVPLGSMPE